VKADVYKQGAERTAAIASCLNTVLIATGCCVISLSRLPF